ncbi:MAG: hypothetical protein PHO02_03050 [Candidatus Nanoarchaeia archaeon]|nr:hypothetical protein [Candidatus Nanoarchaeia archaeon]
MGLEEQLMHCLDANLKHRDEVIEEYGNSIDFMRDYSYHNHFENELATALNISEKRNGILPSDFEGMRILHAKTEVQQYEQRHGIKTFLFDIELPKEKFAALMPKVDGKEWYGGLYFTPSNFRGFYHNRLYLSKFGLAIEQEKGRFKHEAMHCDRRFYTADYRNRLVPDYDADYPDSRWQSLAEISFTEEILCFIAEDFKKENVEKAIKEHYFEAKLDFFSGIYRGITDEQKAEKRKQFEKILEPVKNTIGCAVISAYKLKEQLPSDILAPLLFSIGPASEDIENSRFYSPFGDILLWERCVSQKRISIPAIRDRLQKKGYCPENPLF